jgi:hypothetical protein
MSFGRVLWVVTARIGPAVEGAWNSWYSGDHLPEIAACPGFRASARYVADAPSGRRYLTLYDIETAGAVATPEFNARRGWGPFAQNVEAEARLFQRIGP